MTRSVMLCNYFRGASQSSGKRFLFDIWTHEEFWKPLRLLQRCFRKYWKEVFWLDLRRTHFPYMLQGRLICHLRDWHTNRSVHFHTVSWRLCALSKKILRRCWEWEMWLGLSNILHRSEANKNTSSIRFKSIKKTNQYLHNKSTRREFK